MKASRVGICSRSEGTSGLSRVKCTLSNVMWITCWIPLPRRQVGRVVLGVVVVVVLDVVVVGTVVDVVDVVVGMAVVLVVEVVVVVVLEVVVVVVLPGASARATESTQASMTASSVAALLAFEQSVADASLPIAALNLLSADARQSEGSLPLLDCLDRQLSLAETFLAIAATFFESHLLAVGVVSLAPTAE